MATINNTKEARDKVPTTKKLDSIVEAMRVHEVRRAELRNAFNSFEAGTTIPFLQLNESLLDDLWKQYRAHYHRPTWKPSTWRDYRTFLMINAHREYLLGVSNKST